jgi:hypothetical protein
MLDAFCSLAKFFTPAASIAEEMPANAYLIKIVTKK